MAPKQFTLLTGLFALAAAFAAHGQEKKIARHDLPPAVEKTVVRESQGATVRGFSTEKENGRQIYEASLLLNGHRKEISMDANGKILEVEEEAAIESLPAKVRESLTRLAGTGTITRLESITKGGKLTGYEAAVKTGGKHTEIHVGPAGETPADHK